MKRFCLVLMMLLCGVAAASAIDKSQTVVVIDGAKYYIHTVAKGETLYSLAKTYGVGEQVIVHSNPFLAQGLKAGAKIKIPYTAQMAGTPSERRLRKTFDTHTVEKGETLYAISRRYAIPIGTVIEDNPSLDPILLHPGERILIRRKERGTEPVAQVREQWEAYRDNLNSVAGGEVSYHLVHAGETFYAIARRFGTTEERLSALNGGIQPSDLKAGAIIKVPGNPSALSVVDGTAKDNSSAGNGDYADYPAGRTAREETFTDDEAADGGLFDRFVRSDTTGRTRQPRRAVDFVPLDRNQTLRIALMLPLEVNGAANANYLEFYQGFLLGLDSVKSAGFSVHVDLFNTERNPETVLRITEDDSFRKADLVVGPVYEQVLGPVIRFAEERGIPVVSPLAHIAGPGSDVLFQMAPAPEKKYDKASDLIDGSKRLTLIYTDDTDQEFESEIRSLIGQSEYRKYHYTYEHASVAAQRGRGNSPSDLTALLQNDDDNVFIILAGNELDVDRILAALASANTSIVSRGHTAPRFVVLGNARWNRYNNISREIFFKDHVVFFSTYHAKRDAEEVRTFDSEYIRAFGSLPTLYSYRGYETALIFAPAMFGDIRYDLEGRDYTPLQTTYVFGQDAERDTHVNRNWTRVNYNGNFTITIE